MMAELLPDITEKLDHILRGLPALAPELVLIAAFVASILTGLFVDRLWRHSTFTITVIGILISALCSSFQLSNPDADGVLFGMVSTDAFGQYMRMLIAVVCLLFAFFVHASPDFGAHRKKTADLYSILLAVQIGLNLMALASNWLMVFIAIEMVSIGSYLMVGYLAKDSRQTEAAMKYVLFGAVCSAVMLYGMSLLYGFTGNLDYTFAQHIQGLNDTSPLLVTLALLFVFTGIGFKLTFVPFHFWTPDVYQGAPTPVTAFLSTAPKIAGIALLANILYAWPPSSFAYQHLRLMLVAAAAVTMLWGNLAALRQTDVKRMMAYSSIGHTGFLMMAVLAYSAQDYTVLFYYLAVYSLMNMGVFMLTGYIESRTGAVDVTQYRGLGKAMPLALVCFTLIMISLTGIPPTSGFVAKLLVFTAVFHEWQISGDIGMVVLLIVGALTTVISLFFYFKIPLHAFLKTAESQPEMKPLRYSILWLAVLLTVAVWVVGVFPDWLVG
ncbi:NADH-quinone oxidoreductase subunit N [Parapedobacter sp. 10938]|uniref:NADH-quinone oxidoreductase subunit N n=1 Tax=Parapedobacter flavus TaxID=3110225 RepID=UPI002DB804A8|nr:NADH-quinone oxidoreductase subunit N [Parapedobacter sp. 10938]MEC3878993.1 NADH-quinone oxidoreductase subunit N [Parapedobacter sp. 10938]